MPKTAENYTPEMVKKLHADYDPNAPQDKRDEQVKQLAINLEKSIPSVRMKLVKEGIFVKKGKVAKNGKPSVRKEDLIKQIAANTGQTEHFYRSLEGVTKDVLEFFAEQTTPLSPEQQSVIDEALQEFEIDTMHS